MTQKQTRREVKVLGEAHGDAWSLYHADCVDFVRQIPDGCIDLSVYSPPFANAYTYSDSPNDMGNCADDAEFLRQYAHLVSEMHRVMRPGRIVVVHCRDTLMQAGTSADGRMGLYDFPGEIIRLHQSAGFVYHSRVTIWKDPVVEMQRTKALGLLWKQLRKDSTRSRQGCADYLLVFRKWHDWDGVEPVTHGESDIPVDTWQKWASPVWMDICQTDVLNVSMARDDKDEKHMCPLQLDLIDRCLCLWSNPGDVVFSPFAGVGSEGVGALRRGRKFIGTELKESYFNHATKHLRDAVSVSGQGRMFE